MPGIVVDLDAVPDAVVNAALADGTADAPTMVGEEAANAVRIQYGGSMKPANAAELLSQPDIDGGLIGGAALDVTSFVDIVKAAL